MSAHVSAALVASLASINPAAARQRKLDEYSIRLLGDPCLHTPARDVGSPAEIPHILIEALKRENKNVWAESAGLSAQQVGGLERVTIAKWAEDDDFTVCINLRITERSPELVKYAGEGCLSIPHFRTSTRRHAWVTVAYRDEQWKPITLRLTGFAAQVAQHECDHLEGKLIIDGVSRQQRRAAERAVADYVQLRRSR